MYHKTCHFLINCCCVSNCDYFEALSMSLLLSHFASIVMENLTVVSHAWISAVSPFPGFLTSPKTELFELKILDKVIIDKFAV